VPKAMDHSGGMISSVQSLVDVHWLDFTVKQYPNLYYC